MPRHKAILLLFFALGLTVLIVGLAVYKGSYNLRTYKLPPEVAVNKTAVLAFSPTTIQSLRQPITVDVVVNGQSSLTGVQGTIQYNPSHFTSVVFTPVSNDTTTQTPTNILFNEPDPENGRISFAIGFTPSNPTNEPKKVGTLTLTPTTNSTPSQSTVTFSEGSLVTELGTNQSVLKDTQPLTVTFSE